MLDETMKMELDAWHAIEKLRGSNEFELIVTARVDCGMDYTRAEYRALFEIMCRRPEQTWQECIDAIIGRVPKPTPSSSPPSLAPNPSPPPAVLSVAPPPGTMGVGCGRGRSPH